MNRTSARLACATSRAVPEGAALPTWPRSSTCRPSYSSGRLPLLRNSAKQRRSPRATADHTGHLTPSGAEKCCTEVHRRRPSATTHSPIRRFRGSAPSTAIAAVRWRLRVCDRTCIDSRAGGANRRLGRSPLGRASPSHGRAIGSHRRRSTAWTGRRSRQLARSEAPDRASADAGSPCPLSSSSTGLDLMPAALR